jgi:cytosine/adenosine deaminase-related metal-dependent hydrolase
MRGAAAADIGNRTHQSAQGLDAGITVDGSAGNIERPWPRGFREMQMMEAGRHRSKCCARRPPTVQWRWAGREIGAIAPGMLADLVVLDADPLVDVGNASQIWLVLKGGAIIPGADH